MSKTMNQKVHEGYNKSAKAYSSVFRDQFKNNKHLELLIERLKSGAKVLDVGCGGGKPIDSYLVQRGFEVIGFDISEEQIKLAKMNVPEAQYSVMDMSDLKEGQFQVDAVVSFYALFHIPREQHLHILQLFRTFVKTNGLILLTMGADDWEGKEDDFCGAEMYWSHYGAEKNLDIVEQSGFKVIFSEIDTAGNEKHLIVLAQSL